MLVMSRNPDAGSAPLRPPIGAKSVRMAAHDEAERLTGLKVGGISALGAQPPFEVFLDASGEEFEEIG